MMNTDYEEKNNGRKQAAQVSLQMLPLIMNNIPQAVFWKDRDLVYLGCNQAFAEDAGLSSPDEIIGKTDFDLPWKEQSELYRTDDQRVLESGEAKLNYEEPQTTPDGLTTWLRTSKIPVYEDGKVVAILGMYEDITAHKQVELELLLRDRALASSLNAVIILSFPDNKPIYANDALFKMTGYGFDDVKQLTLLDITGDPEELPKIRSTMQAQGYFIGEELIKRKDGSTFPATFFTSLIRDGKGQPIAVQSSFFDISERKKVEESVLESEERFRRFTEATTEGVVFHERGLIVDTNPSALAMFGLSSNTEVVGRKLLEFIKPEFHELVLKQMQLEAVAPYEVLCVRQDGSVFPVETSTRKYKYGDRDIRATSIRDITRRKQAEAAVHDSEEKLRAIYEGTSDAIMLLTEKGFFDCNLQTLKMFGYRTKEEFTAIHPSDASPAQQPNGQDSMSASQEHIQTAYREGHDRFEWVHRRANGEEFPAEVLLSAFEFSGQRVLQATVRDITERKQIEVKLSESEERYRRLSDATMEGIVVHDKGILQDTNEVFANMFGYDQSEVIGMSATDFLTPETRGITLQNIRTGYEKPYEAVGLRKDGSTFPVEISGKVIHYQGRIARVTTLRDISERKQAEGELLRLQSAVEQTEDGVALADLNGNLIYSNPAWAKMHGYTPDEIPGKYLSIFHTQEQMEREVIPFNEKVMATGSNTDEIGHVRKDGTIFTTLQSVSIQKDRNGTPVGLIGTARDITVLKRAEQELRENQKFLQTVMDNIPQLIFWKDRNLLYLGCNQNFAKAAGVSAPAEIVGKSDYDLAWKKEEAEAFRQDDQAVMSSGQAKYHIIEPQLQADGRQTWADTNKIPMFNAAGEVVGVLGTYEDITERKQLEFQVQEAFERRGLQVQLSTQVSQSIAAAANLGDLYQRVVKQVKEQFGYYHTQLLHYDPAQEAVVLITGYGETGRQMLIDGHKMPLGKGLIGTAAETGETVMRPNLADDPDWQPNPLLPETKGEIAIPIKFGEQILGVLDVQSAYAGALTEDDRLLLEGLCGQIAIAMHNAELVEAGRENEARLAEALRAARLANWEYDVEKDLFAFNDQFYAIFHTTAEKVGGYQLSSARYAELFVHPDDMEVVGTEIGKALNSKEMVYNANLEHRILYADGGVGYIAVKLTVERDENGKITRYFGANQDITERRQSEARLAEALRSARLANWEYDVEKDLFAFNDQFYAIFHTTAEKVGGYQLSSARYAELFVHPDDMEVVGTEIGKALNSKDRVYNANLEHRILYADGGVGYIAVKLTVERDENGKIARYFGANQDITERRQSEARLAEALRSARLANWEYDVEKDLFAFNDQFYAIFHTTAEKVGGYQLSSARYAELFVHPDDMEVVGAEIGKALSSTERVYNANLEHRILYADGGVGYIAVKLTVERDENGKITRYFGANQDITDRKQAEDALRENEQRYQQILDAITDMVLVKGEKSRILWANRAFRDYYGMTNEQLRDMIDAPFAEPDYTLQYVKDDAYVFESGEILHVPEEPVTRYDGVVRKFETVKAPIRDINGNIVMTVGVSRDITERIKEQEAQAERLAEINRLYSIMSREGWKTYRSTTDLPAGFVFDQMDIQPIEAESVIGENVTNIPVTVLGGEKVANLEIVDDPQHPISTEERAFLQQASEQIALALESARLFEQTQSALTQSEQLFQVSSKLSQVADFQELVKVVTETMHIPVVNRVILDLFNYDATGALESVDVAANWWSGTGREPTPIGTRYSIEAVRAMSFLVSQTPVFFSDALNDERFDLSSLQVAISLSLRSGAVLPLHVGSRQIGILFMQAEEPYTFSREETRLLEALAPQISTVLENRRQFERAQKQAEREAMLNTINQKIQSATSVEAVLQIAARELGHALNVPRTIAQISVRDQK